MARDKYEISLWEDYIVQAAGDVPEHFEERKLVVIGSDTMTAACRAYEPKLVENINGTNTFTFKMFYVYRDEQTGEKNQNPFLNLLVNERKVKVYWKDKWYDLVIKNIQEDSSGKSITYTCKDLFINELSKNGYNLEFDNELENNQGSIVELGERVLEGTDWQLDSTNSDSIKQEKEEPLYSATSKAITARNERTGLNEAIPAGAQIYIFYSSVINESNPCQFLYDSTQQYNRDTNSQLIIDVPCYSLETDWSSDTPAVPTTIVSAMGNQVSNEFRGSRLVNSQRSVLDPLTDKYVKVYRANQDGEGYSGPNHSTEPDGQGDVIYAYESTEYKDATFVNNLIVNSKDFSKTEGWIGINDSNVGPFQLYPAYNNTSDISTYTAKSYLKLNTGKVYNTGLRESGSYIPNGIQIGEKYIFRFKAMSDDGAAHSAPTGNYITSGIIPSVCEYTWSNSVPTIVTNSDFIDFEYLGFGYEKTTDTEPQIGINYYIRSYNSEIEAWNYTLVQNPSSEHMDEYYIRSWVEYVGTCIKSFSRNEVYRYGTFSPTHYIGLFFEITNSCWLENMEFFPLVNGEKVINDQTVIERINPGEMDWSSVAQVYYHYYNHTTHQGAIELDDYLYIGTTDWSEKSNLTPVSNNFEKIRSITAKQSNRFNLLQTLAETFECWCQFEIQHDNNGRTLYVNGKPQKFVRFKEKIGEEIGFGFIYGIDLKAISRTIQSDQIVTKTIVSQNNNEFATNGFCTIARSEENYSRDKFILNFDYYITQGLIEGGQLNKDLYSQFQWVDSEGHFQGSLTKGYYTQLRELNIEYDEIADVVNQKELELTKQESYKTVYSNYITALQEEKINIEDFLMKLASVTTWADAQTYIQANPDQPEVMNYMNARQNCMDNLSTYTAMDESIQTSINNLNSVLSTKKDRKKEIENSLKELNYAFYRKYSNYIQEGSWIKEDYIDDTLYYLDAQSVAYTSSRPQISYNVSVARLSSLEEFKSKVFHLGDISYIQDTEFFGYVTTSGILTPYKEKVLVSEVVSNFDDPVQDSFKVQNYKTQFEDLFQRITATTQSLQYASGEYNRAAGIVETTGVIKPETLESSIAYNNGLVSQSNNEQITQDQTGITVVDATNPNKRTKVTSGGIFISTDGGGTWKNAVRGEGISTQYLTAGNINVQNINIIDGNHQTFRWDSTGINAYGQYRSQQQITGVDLSKAVRFDQFGVYGINGIGNAAQFAPDDVEDIKNSEYVKFGLTWDGLFIKNRYNTHYVEISNENDIQVVDTKQTSSTADDVVRVKIGKLDNNIYGIRLKDGTGTTTLETKQDGTLWLRDSLFIGTDPVTGTYKDGIGYLPIATTPVYYNNNINLDSYHKTNDLTPQSGKQYYYYSSITHQMEQFSGNTFDSNIIYYESYNEHRTIDMNNKFVVWEDGTMYAKDGYFEGTINATNGVFSGELNGATGTFTGTVQAGSIIASSVHIGGNSGPTMEQVGESVYKVVIDSSQGTIFKNGTIQTTLTARFYEGATEILSGLTYQWKKNNEDISGATSRTLSVDESVDAGNATILYSCVVTL